MTGAAPPPVTEPSSPPSAPRSCARPAVSARCNNHAADQPGRRAPARSKAHAHTLQIALRLFLRSSDPYQHLCAKPESSQIVDSRRHSLRPSDSVRLTRRANQRYQLAPSHPPRGALAIVTNAGGDAVDAAALARKVIAG